MIFCDLDGVLADFTGAFSKLIQEDDPTMPLVRTRDALDWDTWGGILTKARAKIGWKKVTQTENFWETLDPLPSREVFQRLAACHRTIPILFVTSRTPSAGLSVFHQTINWLEMHGIRDPMVIAPNGSPRINDRMDKADVAEIWNPYFVIDDSPKTSLAFAAAGFEVAMLDWPYTKDTKAPGIIRCGLIEALAMAGVPEL